MAVARVTEISSTSPKSFEDAIHQGISRSTKTLRNVRSAWVKEQRVDVKNKPDRRVPGQPDGDVRPRRLTLTSDRAPFLSASEDRRAVSAREAPGRPRSAGC